MNFQDVYMFVTNEYDNRVEDLAKMYSLMIDRQQFRLEFGETIFIHCINRDIDTQITTKYGQEITLREMIVNIPSPVTRFSNKYVFQSVDYCSDESKVWFKKKQGSGGSDTLQYTK